MNDVKKRFVCIRDNMLTYSGFNCRRSTVEGILERLRPPKEHVEQVSKLKTVIA